MSSTMDTNIANSTAERGETVARGEDAGPHDEIYYYLKEREADKTKRDDDIYYYLKPREEDGVELLKTKREDDIYYYLKDKREGAHGATYSPLKPKRAEDHDDTYYYLKDKA